MYGDSYLIARQPILNCTEEIIAFELLFRSSESISSARFESDVQASSSVIFNTLSTIGVENLIGTHRGFINVDLELLMSDAIELLPQNLVGLELLESIEITPDTIKRCRVLKSLGYLLSLNDHEYNTSCEPLYDGIVDIIKIDLIKTPLTNISGIIERFRRHPVRLLAEKVDSRAMFLRCRSLGFQLFQGYFFARPTLIQKQRLANSVQSFLKLMRQLNDDVETAEIEKTFKESPILVYKLLKLINSVSVGLHDRIHTIHHAIVIIGRQQLKRWVQIALFADDGRQEQNNPIMNMALSRATFMEELAKIPSPCPGCSPDEAFMAGILSVMTEVYDIALEEIVIGLNLSDEIQNALTENKGVIGLLLSVAKMVERIELDEAAECLKKHGLPIQSVFECQKRAFNWHSGLGS